MSRPAHLLDAGMAPTVSANIAEERALDIMVLLSGWTDEIEV
jgi:uncharacterized protein (DUF2237 family)